MDEPAAKASSSPIANGVVVVEPKQFIIQQGPRVLLFWDLHDIPPPSNLDECLGNLGRILDRVPSSPLAGLDNCLHGGAPDLKIRIVGNRNQMNTISASAMATLHRWNMPLDTVSVDKRASDILMTNKIRDAHTVSCHLPVACI